MAKKEEVKVRFKIISVGDYLDKARKLLGDENIWENAIALIYTENKVVTIVNKKGEDKFLVEI